MAIPQNTLIGKTKNSVGGTTFSTWKGINVLKSKAVSVANPNTIGQQNQRVRMSFLVALYQLMSEVVKLGMVQQAVKQSEYNAFVKANLTNGAVTATNAVVTFLADKAVMSEGSLSKTDTVAATLPGAGVVQVTWDTTLADNQLATDLISGVVLDSTGALQAIASAPVARSVGSIDLQPVEGGNPGVGNTVYFIAASTSRKLSENTQRVILP